MQPFCSASIPEQCGTFEKNIPQPRYKHVKSGSGFGKTVFRHLASIKKSLLSDPPRRQSLLRLLKDIAEFILCAKGNQGL